MALPPDKLQIGRTLLAGGPLTQEMLQRELDASQKSGSVLGKALLQSGFPTEEELITPILARLRIPKINASKTTIPLETIRLVPAEVARKHRILPLDQIGGILVVVTPDIAQDGALADVRKATGLVVTPIQCTPEGFDEILDKYYQRLAESAPPVSAPADAGAPAPVPGDGASQNGGVLKAIPVGAEGEDGFWKRFMSSGPIPVDEVLM